MEDVISGLDTAWVLIAAFLVFFMQAGFALVESGFTQAKNAVNIIMKNLLDVCFGTIAYFLLGFGLMFGVGNAVFGQEFFGMTGLTEVWGSIPSWAFFLFQAVFAATAATIVSGAVAERTKFGAYVIFSIVMTALIYPVVGHWVWGGGWLSAKGFTDFAGSTVVHSVGGWAALAGIIVIGARSGRFKNDYDQKRFDGHNIPLAALGVFILWFGWFGFNPGSQLGAEGADNASAIALVAVNTQMAAAAGVIGALALSWLRTKIFNAGFALNGALGGLVAITAPCAVVSPGASILIGFVGGIVIVAVTELLQKLKLDDAVGAVPVHLGAGIWGTLAVGLFALDGGLFYGGGGDLLGVQALGVLGVGAFTFLVSLAVFKLLAMTLGVRADKKEEEAGLDLKHGQTAYPDFASYR
ncbi:ammonium transporter [Candidatus Peregrinibacteria bacterium]|nr:ammonium transporter [Candidatus Peregrinibacteria bacterium]